MRDIYSISHTLTLSHCAFTLLTHPHTHPHHHITYTPSHALHTSHIPHLITVYSITYHICTSSTHTTHSSHTTHSPHSDGQKMSKRLKNYPDPMAVVHKFGADALRLYLINSPVVRAETLKFKESGVKDVVKDVFLPWFNAYRFLLQNIDTLKQVCV